MSRSFASYVRPALEALETREVPAAASIGPLFSQPLGQLVTQMNNALMVLRSDTQNLVKDLGGITTPNGLTTGAPNNIVLQDYTRAAFGYGQIQGLSQGITAVGKADLAFLAVAGGASTSDTSTMMSLFMLGSDLSSANRDLTQAFTVVNANPPNGSLSINFLSVLAFLS